MAASDGVASFVAQAQEMSNKVSRVVKGTYQTVTREARGVSEE
jgi:hypothetical protein